MLGLYSTREKAEAAIEEYFCKEGFNLYSKECFSIDAYEIDCDTGWTSGFECRDGEYWLPVSPNNSDKSLNCTGPGSEYSKTAIWKKYGEKNV